MSTEELSEASLASFGRSIDDFVDYVWETITSVDNNTSTLRPMAIDYQPSADAMTALLRQSEIHGREMARLRMHLDHFEHIVLNVRCLRVRLRALSVQVRNPERILVLEEELMLSQRMGALYSDKIEALEGRLDEYTARVASGEATECPVCYEEFGRSKIVDTRLAFVCRAGCWQLTCGRCFQKWRAVRADQGKEPTCPVCRLVLP